MENQDTETLAAQAIEAQNFNEAIRLLKPLADDGSECALLSLGWIYDQALNETSTKNLAREYYVRAALSGSSEAYYYLGWFYLERKDTISALNSFKSGAEQQHLGCMSMLGKMLVDSDKDGLEFGDGLAWLQKAAAQGHIMAKRNILAIREREATSLWRKILLKIEILRLAKSGYREYRNNANSAKVT